MLNFHVKVERPLWSIGLSTVAIRTIVGLSNFIVATAEMSLAATAVPMILTAQIWLVVIILLHLNCSTCHATSALNLVPLAMIYLLVWVLLLGLWLVFFLVRIWYLIILRCNEGSLIVICLLGVFSLWRWCHCCFDYRILFRTNNPNMAELSVIMVLLLQRFLECGLT